MAEGEICKDFDLWLAKTLQSLDADENVFTSYIRGILEGEDTTEEKHEALQSLLSDMTENDTTPLAEEILAKWALLTAKGPTNGAAPPEGVDVTLARLMENQAIACTVRSNSYTAEEKRIREAILSQYGQYSDDEGDESTTPATGSCTATSGGGLERNKNAALVAQAEREKREQAKIDSQKKKDKDKEDREKQKQNQADKKEKRKTQKGERRR